MFCFFFLGKIKFKIIFESVVNVIFLIWRLILIFFKLNIKLLIFIIKIIEVIIKFWLFVKFILFLISIFKLFVVIILKSNIDIFFIIGVGIEEINVVNLLMNVKIIVIIVVLLMM